MTTRQRPPLANHPPCASQYPFVSGYEPGLLATSRMADNVILLETDARLVGV